MNNLSDEEQRILHGFNYEFGTGNAAPVKPNEIFWLAQMPIPGGKFWRKENNDLNTASLKVGNYLENDAATRNAVERSLNYLQDSPSAHRERDIKRIILV